MGVITSPKPAKLIAGILLSPAEAPRDRVFARLTETFGPIDKTRECLPFDKTDYYAGEMGSTLLRCFVSFETLVNPGDLSGFKHASNNLEAEFKNAAGGRAVNIDPGLITLENLILATTKNFTHRIYLGRGIYGDLTLIFQKGRYHALPWTYPDYSDPEALIFFHAIRDAYREQLKGQNNL